MKSTSKKLSNSKLNKKATENNFEDNRINYELNAILINQATKELFLELKKMPTMAQIAKRSGLTARTIQNHRKDFDKIWKEILLPKYKSEFASTVMENIIISTRKNSGSQKLAMQIFGIIEQDKLQDGVVINVHLPESMKIKTNE